MTQDKVADEIIIAYRLQRMMSAHSWEELTQIDAFREDVKQLTTAVLDQ